MNELLFWKIKTLEDMKEYIKVFNSASDYNAFKATAQYYKPNVSYIISALTILYNPISNLSQQGLQIDTSKNYLTFVAQTSGTFQFSNTVDYSIDGGITWTTLSSNTNTPTINAGDTIMWKASLTPTSSGIGTFSSTGTFVAKGNTMSLLFGSNFVGQTSLYGKDYVFYNLFHNCTGLTNSQNLLLSATTLSDGCYKSMFSGCTNLISSPSLSATVLTEGCYESMFSGCTSLSITPELKALTLVQDCYKSMFYGCSSVDYIKCLATDISATDCTDGWVDGVASSGTFIKAYNNSSWTVGDDGIPTNWQAEAEVDYSQQYLTFRLTTTGEISFTKNTLDYSIDDGVTWTTLTSGYTPLLPAGTKILWRGNARQLSSSSGVGKFISTANFIVEGNVLSIVYGDDFASYDDIPSGSDSMYFFYQLFYGCTGLTRAENLILPTQAAPYHSTFMGCTLLVTAPKLPCIQHPSYYQMFSGCSSLIYPPELPSTLLDGSGYSSMFKNCTSLIKAPELPATLLTDRCYSEMFYGCTSLTEAPELPSTVMKLYCYEKMFYGCTNLTKAPSLLYASNLDVTSSNTQQTYGCYRYMFYGCRSLTKGPDILSTLGYSRSACEHMFENCTNLNYVKCLINDGYLLYIDDWLKGVSSTGTFVKTSGASFVSGQNGIPDNWTVIEV